MPNIEWRDIPGYVNYEVSRCGQVRRKPAPLRPVVSNLHGYGKVALCDDGDVKQVFIHRLVCEVFHGPPPQGKMVVAHWNGDKLDNRAENLRWATQMENIHDSIRLGRHPKGEDVGNSKLSEADVREMRRVRIEQNWSYQSLGDKFGVSPKGARDACVGKNWSHVDGYAPITNDRRPKMRAR